MEDDIKLIKKSIRDQRKELCEIHKRISNESDQEVVSSLKQEFQQKMDKNIELKKELMLMQKEKP